MFRVFCRRVARSAYPDEVNGSQFYAICDSGDPEDEPDANLSLLLRRREEIMPALRRVFANNGIDNAPTGSAVEAEADGMQEFAEGELSGFLRALVPLYDPPAETIPTATRGIADLLNQLLDENDPRANAVIDTVARLVKRLGYRTPEQNIGALRAILTYPGLDDLSATLLPVVTGEGAAKDEFIAVLNALALELADDPVPVANPADSTLRYVNQLALTEDDTQGAPEIPYTPVLRRDENGDALGDVNAGTPFPVAGREDDANERDRSGIAMIDGAPAYQSFDAGKTVLSALMRETSALIARGDRERSPVEAFAHGVRPLLGPWGSRSLTIGQNNYEFQGPDIQQSALMELAHAAIQLLRYPETIPVLRALDKVINDYESESTGVDFASLAISERSKEERFDSAKLNGPHDFWSDMTAVAVRMGQRPGLFDALIRSFTHAESGQTGKLFATWMRHNDHISYPNAPSTDLADINKPVSQTFESLVDRGQLDVGFNRSVWQRTLSLIHALNGMKVCNKQGAVLSANTNIGLLHFPAFNPAGYNECEVVEIASALEIYTQSVVGNAKIGIKDAFADILAFIGSATGLSGSVGQIQEAESGITGFNTEPSPQSLARFIFAPRNEWLTKMFDPQATIYPGVAIVDYEPDALFPVEVLDPKTPLPNGDPGSFILLGQKLLEAFELNELRDTDLVTGATTLRDGYMFGHFMSAMHKHWPQRKGEDCPPPPAPGNEGCTQSLDPAAPFYSPQTGLVSYEELLAEAFDDEDFLGILHKATIALQEVKVQDATGAEIDGITALSSFVQRLVTPDPTLKKWDGSAVTGSQLCVIEGEGCRDNVGTYVPQLAPIHLVADALHSFDKVWAENEDRHQAWLDGRSGIIDQLLATTRSGSPGNYTYSLNDRTAFNLVHPLLDWAVSRIQAHNDAGDLGPWVDGLPERLAKVLRHPITAGVVDLLDAFWPEIEASGEFTEVVAFMTDARNTPQFTGMLTAIADSMLLLDHDQNLSPAIQFAALALAPNSFQAIEGAAVPNASESAAYAALEMTGGVVATLNDPKQNKFKKEGEPTALAKLLNNAVLASGDQRSALEVLIDATADANRPNTEASILDPLTAEEDRDVFNDVKLFLRDDSEEQRSLERLWSVIQNRKVNP